MASASASSESVSASEEKPEEPNAEQPTFESLKGAIHPRTLQALTDRPFRLKHMSPVQAAVLPLLPDLVKKAPPGEEPTGPRDLMVKARTGTGKTLGFLVPALESRLNDLRAHAEQVAQDTSKKSKSFLSRAVHQYAKENIGTLIISPTRELATQIANEAIKLTEHHDAFEVRLFVGGLPKGKQMREWHTGRRDIVVATPGRLRDFIENESGFRESLKTTQVFILDEADTLLEMGFREDIEAIAQELSPDRQTFMFSATMAKAIQQVAASTLAPDYKFINCVPDDAPPTHAQIPQFYTPVPSAEEQLPHILRLIAEDQLQNPGKSKVLIFLPTTRMVKLYSTLITQLGPSVLPAGNNTRFAEMHSKKAMTSRMNTSDWFRRDTSGASVMLTSDVSARGVDYPGVTRVIQVGVPANGDSYIHRVGRTGRGRNMATGRADLVLMPWELGFVQWQLADVPIRELKTTDVQDSVSALATKYDADPQSFFPGTDNSRSRDMRNRNTPRRFPPNVASRLEDISQSIQELQPQLDVEEVKDTMLSMLAFYASNAGSIRLQRNATVEGVKEWATVLVGQPVTLRIPREFMDMKPRRDQRDSRSSDRYKRSYSDRPMQRWQGRGSTRSKMQDRGRDNQRGWDESRPRKRWEDNDDGDIDSVISGSGRRSERREWEDRGSRGGDRDRSWGDRGSRGGDRDRSWGRR